MFALANLSFKCIAFENGVSVDLSFRFVSKQVFSALQSLTSVFGMGTGGPFALETLTLREHMSTENRTKEYCYESKGNSRICI